RGQHPDILKQRRDAIAEAWFQAVGHAGYVAMPADRVRARLAALLDEVLSLFLVQPLDRRRAEEVGEALAGMHLVQARALADTLEVLGRELALAGRAAGLPNLELHLSQLMGALAAGHFRRSCRTVLSEQEETRTALVTELRTTEQALRQARDDLEIRVQERTAELARANEGLRAEITERQRAEHALRQSEEKYRLLVESLQDGVYTLDMEGRFTFMNEVGIQRAGWARAEFLGRSSFDLVRPEDRPQARRYFEAIIRGEEVPISELAYVNAEGREVWLELNSSALRVAGQIVGVQGISRDVTQRKRAERALQESEDRWRSLVENAPDIVVTLDRRGRILYMNRVAEMADETVEELVGTDVFSYVEPEHRPALREAIDAAFEGQEGGVLEMVTIGARGVPVWQAVRVGPVWRDGQVASVMAVVRDISEQKRVQEMKDNLIRDVSHELRTPLAKVRMSLDVLDEINASESPDRARAERINQLATRNVDRLLRTVEGVLDLSRLENGLAARGEHAIAPEELVEETVQYMAPLAEARGLALEADLPRERLPLVIGDRERLFRVLVNLVDNACKFTEQGRVVVSARSRDGLVELAVADTGQGIEPEMLGRVFDRFYQAKTHVEGVGIGLTICKAIVEVHGGRIWAESQGQGQGATFRFTLPPEPSGSDA
ncbi:MAG: PAS domain S-box protein, partial [Anaerolineae bacterium]